MKNLFLSLLIITGLNIFGQSHTISGYVEDASSKERLIGVNVFLKGTTYGTSTNTYGFYSLTVPEGEYELIASFLGYHSFKDSIQLDADRQLDMSMQATSENLEEVSVYAEELQAEQAQMSTVKLNVADIKKIPAFLGEVDIIRAIQLLPGVQSGSEGTTGFYVRGGSPDQNLILLDGVPVYNASHLFGFFSVFNADAIKNVQLTKGGFPARYGGRLSSVLEIDMKEGNMKEFHGQGAIGLISSKLTLEGPIVKDKTSFMISGRRTYVDVLAAPFVAAYGDGERVGYFFGDVNLKLNHIFSRKDRLYLSYYGGTDKFYYRYKDNYQIIGSGTSVEEELRGHLKWGNHTGSLRWNHLFSDKLFGNLSATFSQYEFNVGFEQEFHDPGPPEITAVSGFENYSRIRDYGLRYDFDYVLNTKHNLKFGGSYTHHTFTPGALQFLEQTEDVNIDSTLNLSEPIYANDVFMYIEDDYNINQRLRANFGLHYSMYFLDEAFYHSLQPRASLRYLLTNDWSLKGSYAMMNQYIHLLTNSGIGLPTDLWVSSTENIKPQLSQQIALGTTKNFDGSDYEFSTEIYYKWMDNLIEYKEGAGFVSAADWRTQVETGGKGWAYGLEILLRKNSGPTTGWIGYTLARSNRQFENLNNGEIFPYKYDRRHDISVVVNHKFSEKFDIGATWVYGSGNTFTTPISTYLLRSHYNDFYPQEVTRYSSRNGERMPAYHRFDIGFNFHKEKEWGSRTWNISVYNAYNRKNPFFLYIQEDYQTGAKRVKQVSLFPIIPSVSYIFNF